MCHIFKKETKTTNAKRSPEWTKSKDLKKELTTKSVEQLKKIIEARKKSIQIHCKANPQNVETANLLKKICEVDTTGMDKEKLVDLCKLTTAIQKITDEASYYGPDPCDNVRAYFETRLDSITQEPKKSSFKP